MAEAFNLNNFLREQASYNLRQYTAVENGKAAMEARAIEKAEEAVNNVFLGLTLSEKLTELGVGKRVLKQIEDTATGTVKDIIKPLTDWLNKYEKVFDQDLYNSEIQSMGKQMFFAKQYLAAEAASSQIAQKFVFDM